jgi:hypothetical protein
MELGSDGGTPYTWIGQQPYRIEQSNAFEMRINLYLSTSIKETLVLIFYQTIT